MSVLYSSTDDYYFSYLGYQCDAGSSLQSLNCPANTSNLYLAVVTSPGLNQVTAEFCQPTYWIQEVNVTVTASDMAVISSTPLAPAVELSQDDFKSSIFQTIIWTGRPGIDVFPRIKSFGDVIIIKIC